MYEENQIVPNSDSIREELLWRMTHDISFIDTITVTTDRKDKIHTRFDKWLFSVKEVVGAPKTEPRAFTIQYKKQLWESNPTCAICRQKIHVIDDAEIDHIEQYWRGGKTILANARLTHRYCNRSRLLVNKGDSNAIKTVDVVQIPKKMSQTKYLRVIIKGERTPRQAFRISILEVLIELRGKGKVNEILEKVEIKMKKVLKPVDYEKLPSGVMIRWQNTAQWERYIMVQDGLLRSDSPKGTWEITDEGKRLLKNY